MMSNITELPEDCLAYILSLTSPGDVLRSSAVSKRFLSVSGSNTVWDKFIPSDSDDIISRSSSSIPPQIVSKKDLFMHLCDFPILFDNNTMSFGLDKRTGKICYTLGSKMLVAIWDNHPEYWSRESIPESRFPECNVLKAVCWLHVFGRIPTTVLSPGTTYGVYFVFKIKVDFFYSTEFGKTPIKVSVSEISEDGLPRIDGEIKHFFLKEPVFEEGRPQTAPGDPELPIVREDGWMEIEMGRYQAGVNSKSERVVLEMSLREIEILNWKGGLVVHSIELRPLS